MEFTTSSSCATASESSPQSHQTLSLPSTLSLLYPLAPIPYTPSYALSTAPTQLPRYTARKVTRKKQSQIPKMRMECRSGRVTRIRAGITYLGKSRQSGNSRYIEQAAGPHIKSHDMERVEPIFYHQISHHRHDTVSPSSRPSRLTAPLGRPHTHLVHVEQALRRQMSKDFFDTPTTTRHSHTLYTGRFPTRCFLRPHDAGDNSDDERLWI